MPGGPPKALGGPRTGERTRRWSMGARLQTVRKLFSNLWRRGKQKRTAIEPLPLDRYEPSVRPLPISTDAPRILGLRRIHIVNRGTGTTLSNWEVWTSVPGRKGLTKARVISEEEWDPLREVFTHDDGVPVLCREDVLKAPQHRRIKRDVLFVAEGLMPDAFSTHDIDVQVRFMDRANKVWTA